MGSPKSSVDDIINLPNSDDKVIENSPAAGISTWKTPISSPASDNNPLSTDAELFGKLFLSEDDLDGLEAGPDPELYCKTIVLALPASRFRVDGNGMTTRKQVKRGPKKSNREVTPRRCSHCSAKKTPQWRVGPAGPGTLCNACGVRYKSGRMVPECMPAGSPKLDPESHSKTHRKIKPRKQKDGESTAAAAAEGSAV
ncbi:hypothetical protein V2J09_005479 [Rumex salicifolius]